MDAFVAPLTGELLDADSDIGVLNGAINDAWEEIERLKHAVTPLMERRAELRGPSRLPRRSQRTDLQNTICPRCRREWDAA